MDKYQPTKDELAIINERFAKEAYKSCSDLYTFPAMIIDNRMTAYYTRVHPTFLEQCVKDLFNGVGFLIGHNRDDLPMARSFKGTAVSNGEVMEVFAKFFMQKDLEINKVNTDEFMKAFLGGTIEDVSIGFAAKKYECNICGNDIRTMDCPHWPGKRYNDKNKEDENGTLCFAWVKEPAGPSGEALLEVSAVYKGAAPKAKQKKSGDVPKFVYLAEGKNLKEMPVGEPIAINFSFSFNQKGGEKGMNLKKFLAGECSEEDLKKLVLSNEDVDTILKQEVSEEGALKIKIDKEHVAALKEYPASELLIDKNVRWTRAHINSLSDESFAVIEGKKRHLPHHNDKGEVDLVHLKDALARVEIVGDALRKKAISHLEEHKIALKEIETKGKLSAAETNNRVLLDQISGYKQVISSAETELQEIKVSNVALQEEVNELKPIADDGKAYREDLIQEVLSLGIKLHGNSYEKDTNETMLREPTRKLEEIKSIKGQYLNELDEKFPRKQTSSAGAGAESKVESNAPDEAFKQ